MSIRSKKEKSGLTVEQHRKLINGEEDTWCEIVKEYTPDLMSFAHYLSGRNKSLSEDILQETFLEAIRCIKTLKNRNSFKSWLEAICKRVGLAIIASDDNYHRAIRKFDDIESLESMEGENWKLLSDKERLSMIEKNMSKLSPQQRIIIHRRYRSEMSIFEIARFLNTSQNNVRSQLSQAIHKLRNLLEQ